MKEGNVSEQIVEQKQPIENEQTASANSSSQSLLDDDGTGLPKVLIVNQLRPITDMVRNFCQQYSEEFSLVASNRPDGILTTLEEHQDVKLIVTDYRLLAEQGVDIIDQVREVYPYIHFILMPGHETEECVEKVDGLGFVRSLTAPFGMPELVRTIREILPLTVSLTDVLNLAMASGGGTLIKISCSEGSGEIEFANGEIVHAEVGELTGAEGFFKIASWQNIEFDLCDPPKKRERTIYHSLDQLWAEASQRRNQIADETSSTHRIISDETCRSDAHVLDDTISTKREAGDFNKPLPTGMNEAINNFAGFTTGFSEELPESLPAEPRHSTGSPWDNLFIEDIAKPFDVEDILSEEGTLFTNEMPVFGELGIEDLNAESCVNYYQDIFPAGIDVLNIEELPLQNLEPLLKRHLVCKLQWSASSIVHTENAPFSLENPRIAAAVSNLQNAVFRYWRLSRSDFTELLWEAAIFHLARSLNPCGTVAEYLHNHCEGKLNRMKDFLSMMLIRQVLESEYQPLYQIISGYESKTYSRASIPASKISEQFRNYFSENVDDILSIEMPLAIKRILEINAIGNDNPPQSIQQHILIEMLQKRGLWDAADYIRQVLPEPDAGVSLPVYHQLLRNFIL